MTKNESLERVPLSVGRVDEVGYERQEMTKKQKKRDGTCHGHGKTARSQGSDGGKSWPHR
jgi:hypothetical protein